MLLRHGRTAWNADGRAQGHADIELDDTGHAQAAAVAPHLAGLRPAALWSSDLARARQTVAYVEKETGLVATLDPRLREYSVGERTGLTQAEFRARFPAEYAAWEAGRFEALAGAEGRADVLARIVPACQELLTSVDAGQTAVAVTHGAALKVALVALLGWEPSLGDSLHGLDNCAVAVLQENGSPGALRLVAYNAAPDFASLAAGG
ncbi:MAG: histidine phosphatase family protein [Nocardioides sp.]